MSRGQARSLLRLRWSMVRRTDVRVGLVLLGLAALGALVLAGIAPAGIPLGNVTTTDVGLGDISGGLPPDRTGEVTALLPSAYLVFLLTSLVGPISAGGAYELLPEDQLVAFPVRPRTLVRLSLVLSPLNIAWYVELLLITVSTSYAIRGPYAPALPLLVLFTFVIACTTAGQALAWLTVAVRRRRAGRVAARILLSVMALSAVLVVRADMVTTFLDQSPTKRVLAAQLQSAVGDLTWIRFACLMGVISLVSYLIAGAASSWALRRAGDGGAAGSTDQTYRQRTPAPSAYTQLVRIDRASVWRSAPLRRGLLVLGILPGAAAALAGLSWPSLAMLPPLVASGAALLFGVNALCLDGSGALWIATMPQDPQLVLRAKARVVAEMCLAAVVMVVLICGFRAGRPPTMLEVVCVIGSAAGSIALVTTMCMRLSVRRPHRADLRGPRDTPAPPGTMAVYSLRLAGTTTTLGLVFAAATYGASLVVPIALTAALLLWSAWSWRRTNRAWRDPIVRAFAVTTVAAG